MGDIRFTRHLEAVTRADDKVDAVLALSDEQVVEALAAAARERADPLLANILATEATNRMTRSRAITHHVAEGIYGLDPRGCVTFVNPAAERLLGWTRAELVRRSMHETVHWCRPSGEALPREECAILAVLRTGEVAESDGEAFVRKDGSMIRVAYVAAPILRDGIVSGAVVAFRDVTERKQAERLLEAEATLLHEVASGRPLQHVLGELARFSDGATEGASASVHLVDESGTRLKRAAAPGLAAAYSDALRELRIGPASGSCGTAAFENAPVHSSDISTDPRWVEHRDVALAHGLRACWSTPIRDEDGGVVGTFALHYRDARAPTAFEERLVQVATHIAGIAVARSRYARVRERLAAILESTHDGVYSTDEEGRVTTWNHGARQLFGYPPGEMLGRPEDVLVPAHQRAEQRVLRTRALRGEHVRQHRTQRVTRDGRVLTLSVSVSALKDGNGVIVGTSTIARPAPRREPERVEPRVEAGAGDSVECVVEPPRPREHRGAPPTRDEAERLEALRRHGILDTPPEEEFEDVVQLARDACDVPIALVSLVDADRQWFKAEAGLGTRETPREFSFCAHAIHDPTQVLVVEDATRDDRFRANPLVTGPPFIRFYAGAPIVDPSGHALGTLCIIDRVPRTLDPRHERALRALARQVARLLDLRRAVGDVIAHGSD